MPAFDMLRNINDKYAVNSQNHIIDLLTGQDTGQILTADIYQNILNGSFNPYSVMTVPNFTIPGKGGKNPGKLAGMFSGLRGKFGEGKSLLGGGVNLSKLQNLGSDIRATQLFEGGPTIGGAATAGMGIYQGGKALKGIYENTQTDRDLESLKNDINTQVVSNPMYDMYMDASDEKLLRQMRNGTLNNDVSNAVSGAFKGIPQAALSTLIGGLTGGPVGAAVGGLGSLANSAIEGYGQDTQNTQAKLQGLYNKLQRANEDYRSMKRPSGLRQAGLSTRYFNQLY